MATSHLVGAIIADEKASSSTGFTPRGGMPGFPYFTMSRRFEFSSG